MFAMHEHLIALLPDLLPLQPLLLAVHLQQLSLQIYYIKETLVQAFSRMPLAKKQPPIQIGRLAWLIPPFQNVVPTSKPDENFLL